MRIALLPIVAASFAVALISPETASAGRLPRAKPTPVPEKSKAYSEIKSVAGDTITIEHSKTDTTYKMSSQTAIQVDGQRTTSNALKPGMHVEVTASSLNPNLLLSVNATTPPKG